MPSSLVTIPKVELVSTGEWETAMTGTITIVEKDLKAIIASLDDPAVKEPRLIIGHTELDSPGMTPYGNEGFFGEQPSLGKFTNLQLTNNGQTISADLVGVPKWLAEIMPTAYASRSVEVWRDVISATGAKHSAIMPRVALLGISLPAVATIEDLQIMFSAEGPEGVEVRSVGEKVAASRGVTMPKIVAASVQYEDVRRDFYKDFATEESGRYWWWVCSVYVDPPLLIVDDDEENLWAVPYSVAGEGVEFGDPVKVKVQYAEDDGAIAASAGVENFDTGRRYSMAASRPPDRIRMETNKVDLKKLRERLQLTEEQLPDDATDEQINAALDIELPEPEVKEPEAKEDDAKTEPAEEVKEAVPEGEPVAASGVTVDRAAWEETQRTIADLTKEREERVGTEDVDYVAACVKEGKIPPARRDHYIKLMGKDRTGTREFLASLEAGAIPVKGTEIGTAEDNADGITGEAYELNWLNDDERDRVMAARSGKTGNRPRIIAEA